MFDVVRKSLRLIGRERRWRWVLLVVLAFVASGLEMLGAVLVFVLLAVVADPGGQIEVPVVGDLRRLAGDVEETTLLLWLAGGMAVFFVIRFVMHVGVTYAQKRVAHNAGAALAKRLVLGYLAMPYTFHLQRNSAELIRTANAAATNVVTNAYIPMIRVSADTVLAISLLLVMFVVSPLATLLAIAVVGSAAGLLLIVVQPRLKRLGKTTYQLQRATLGSLNQAFQGLRDIKLLGRERYFARDYGVSVDRLARASYLRATVGELPRHVMETALIGFILLYFALALIGGQATDGVLSILGLFAYVGLRLQPSLNRVISSLNELKFASAAVAGVYDDIALAEQVTLPGSDVAALPFEHELRLSQVSFSYEDTPTDALSDVSLRIRRGETVGICGPTGGGKTTLVDLISGLLQPTRGRITIDGEDLSSNTVAWQRNLGVVPQMVFLIDDTLRRNIALGVPDEQIDEDALAAAVALAQLDEFVERIPDGLETVVGEQGVRVSGGQRQRIAIARALYRHADVLIFDEGTSALDNTTEAHLMGALNELRGEHTIVLVAHRLSTVRDCDQIVYVESGRVAGLGTYDELMRTSDGFRALASSR